MDVLYNFAFQMLDRTLLMFALITSDEIFERKRQN